MGGYKIKVNIEIVECEEGVDVAPKQLDEGAFEFNIAAGAAESIDECEQVLLKTNYPVIRSALAHHLESISKKNLKPKSKEITGR